MCDVRGCVMSATV
uniref:Uncharacterized protein n=1 Tax=Anguilla anguilla TaxID=7936 RepID=A0A0E9TPW4_ANGAN